MRIYYFGKLIADTSVQTKTDGNKGNVSMTPVSDLLKEAGEKINTFRSIKISSEETSPQ